MAINLKLNRADQAIQKFFTMEATKQYPNIRCIELTDKKNEYVITDNMKLEPNERNLFILLNGVRIAYAPPLQKQEPEQPPKKERPKSVLKAEAAAAAATKTKTKKVNPKNN